MEGNKSQGKVNKYIEKNSDCLGYSEESELTGREIWFHTVGRSLKEVGGTR